MSLYHLGKIKYYRYIMDYPRLHGFNISNKFLLVLYLEIKMSCEPIIEEGLFNITCSLHLEPDPWLSGITIYVHRDVVWLTDPGKPVTLKHPINSKIQSWIIILIFFLYECLQNQVFSKYKININSYDHIFW